MAKGKNVLTTGEVAKICNVAPRTVSKWFDSGQLKGYRIPGSKDRRIPLKELVRFMKAHNMPAKGLAVGSIRVLLVDSDLHTTRELGNRLEERADYEIEVVTTDFEAGVFVHKFAPHVILINLFSQDIEASEICANIKNNEELQSIKVLAMAQQIKDADAKTILLKGFDDYITDLTSIDEIITKIENATAIIY